jgi:hypothetical protein
MNQKLRSISGCRKGLFGPYTASVVIMPTSCLIHSNKLVSDDGCALVFARDLVTFERTDRFMTCNASPWRDSSVCNILWNEAAYPPLSLPPNLPELTMSFAF